MKLALLFSLIIGPFLAAEDKVISQARFFRLLGIKPTEKEATPFGGLNTVVITHKALLGNKKKLEFASRKKNNYWVNIENTSAVEDPALLKTLKDVRS